ncbi:MAG: hypothetical protein SXV54_05715, partial [Chloroflexota bacterium]|nr:hypothetical protein [Chloroflexota bacterium]
MNSNTSMEQQNDRSDITSGVVRWLIQVGVFILILAAVLFLSSGRLDWRTAWVYIGTYVAIQAITALVLIPSSPELLLERSQSEGPRDLDRVLAGIMSLY